MSAPQDHIPLFLFVVMSAILITNAASVNNNEYNTIKKDPKIVSVIKLTKVILNNIVRNHGTEKDIASKIVKNYNYVVTNFRRMRTIYNQAIKSINTNFADTIMDNVSSAFNSMTSVFLSSSKKPNKKPKPGLVQNFTSFFKSITSLFSSGDEDDDDEDSSGILDDLASMFDYVNDAMRSLKQNDFNQTLNSVYFSFDPKSDMILVDFVSNNASSRQMKVQKSKLIQYLLVPALAMTGIMPYVLPPLKMGVMLVTSLTNMAFMTALVSLVRGIIFDPDPSRRVVIYPNYGYKNNKHKMPPLYDKDTSVQIEQNHH